MHFNWKFSVHTLWTTMDEINIEYRMKTWDIQIDFGTKIIYRTNAAISKFRKIDKIQFELQKFIPSFVKFIYETFEIEKIFKYFFLLVFFNYRVRVGNTKLHFPNGQKSIGSIMNLNRCYLSIISLEHQSPEKLEKNYLFLYTKWTGTNYDCIKVVKARVPSKRELSKY